MRLKNWVGWDRIRVHGRGSGAVVVLGELVKVLGAIPDGWGSNAYEGFIVIQIVIFRAGSIPGAALFLFRNPCCGQQRPATISVRPAAARRFAWLGCVPARHAWLGYVLVWYEW